MMTRKDSKIYCKHGHVVTNMSSYLCYTLKGTAYLVCKKCKSETDKKQREKRKEKKGESQRVC